MLSITKRNLLIALFLIVSLIGTIYFIFVSPTTSLGDSLANELEKKNYRYAPQVGGFN